MSRTFKIAIVAAFAGIAITIHGAMDATLDDVLYGRFNQTKLPRNLISLGKIQSARVREVGPTQTRTQEFPLTALHEIERTTGAWPWSARSRPALRHELCRVWAGNNPEPFRDVSASSEWHATLRSRPINRAPGILAQSWSVAGLQSGEKS
jgi:hypothetical protein